MHITSARKTIRELRKPIFAGIPSNGRLVLLRISKTQAYDLIHDSCCMVFDETPTKLVIRPAIKTEQHITWDLK